MIASSNDLGSAKPSDGNRGKVYVVLVNWNGWQDTIECLESVFRLSYPTYQVIVCDNASEDNSLECLQQWAQGSRRAAVADHPLLRPLTFPPVAKPISWVTYDRTMVQRGGDELADTARLILIRNDQNRGFAAGNNLALQLALARGDLKYAWLVNNDTLVAPGALAALVRCAQRQPQVGLCSSTLLYYDAPDIVQTRGGIAYNRWFATMTPLEQGTPLAKPVDQQRIERLMSYPAGASMLVTAEFLDSVGLLSEDYFLYYEELDWVRRAGSRFSVLYSPDSLVYHKEGRSIGTAQTDTAFHRADYYAHRNRLRYTRRFFPIGLPTTILRTLLAVIARLWRRKPRRAWSLVRLICSPSSYSLCADHDPDQQ